MIVAWQPKENLHKLLGDAIITSSRTYDTQPTINRQQWHNALHDSAVTLYQHVPVMTTIITRVLMRKLQGCIYSTVSPFLESPTTISIACFTPITAAARNQETLALKQVDMDDQLDQASQHRTAISRILHKNYLIHKGRTGPGEAYPL